MHLARAPKLAGAAVDQHEVGPLGLGGGIVGARRLGGRGLRRGRGRVRRLAGRGASFIRREKRRRSTSRIMPKSSPGVMSVERMLKVRYSFLRKPSGPATTMAPTALVPMMWELS